jgi:hypothetical protein
MVVTFLPFNDLDKTARVLDNVRLNKQVLECEQIIATLEGTKTGYKNHPAVAMWKGHIDALKHYFNIVLKEWKDRGKNSTRTYYEIPEEFSYPWWWNLKQLHLTHKLSLYRKAPDHYTAKLLELSESDLALHDKAGYIWPSKVLQKYNDIDLIFSLSVLELADAIGMGAPAHYRWSLAEVEQWTMAKELNPRTRRKISSKSKTGIYADLQKAYDHYHALELI